jgi:hypothetical protein
MDPRAKRAGRYVLQPAGYRAFIPAPLSPYPPLVIDDQLWDLLSQAERALGNGLERLPQLPISFRAGA